MDCYSIPRDLYPMLCSRLGKFKLEHYWGPMASPKAGDWIASATAHVMANDGPELLFSYLPTLDYDFQRFGPGHPKAAGAINALASQINQLTAAAEEAGYDWLLWGDYSIVNVEEGPLFPNRLLADDGLLKTREVAGRSYPDFHASRAFAMVDHAVAHIYIKDHGCIQDVISLLGAMPGVEKMFGGSGAKEVESFHRRGGEIILLAEKGAWFAYPWWDDTRKAPDYATHVDIHNKPGFDPCELLFQWFPPGVTQNQDRIKGTHGRIDSSVAWSGSIEFEKRPTTLKELAEAVGGHLQKALSS
jgi:predicted AlkP superfamily pyrophosphatase or phosphodiesterase